MRSIRAATASDANVCASCAAPANALFTYRAAIPSNRFPASADKRGAELLYRVGDLKAFPGTRFENLPGTVKCWDCGNRNPLRDPGPE